MLHLVKETLRLDTSFSSKALNRSVGGQKVSGCGHGTTRYFCRFPIQTTFQPRQQFSEKARHLELLYRHLSCLLRGRDVGNHDQWLRRLPIRINHIQEMISLPFKHTLRSLPRLWSHSLGDNKHASDEDNLPLVAGTDEPDHVFDAVVHATSAAIDFAVPPVV